MEEREIDLRIVIYKTLRRWRRIVLFGIAAAVVLGLYATAKNLIIINDEEKLTAERVAFEIEHGNWEATETILRNQMESIKESQARQEEYNAKSMLMKIDPLMEYVGNMSLYIDSEFMINPELSYQNIDFTQRLLAAYQGYMSGGEMYEYLLERTDMVGELKYLEEILSFYTDSATASINVTVRGRSEEEVREIFELIKDGIGDKHEEFNRSISGHSYTLLNESVYSQVNFELDDIQKKNREYIVECNQTFRDVQLELEKWGAEGEPSFEYTGFEIVKNIIKMCLIGGLAGVFAGCAWYAMRYVVTGKLSGNDIWKIQGINFLGSVHPDPVKSGRLGVSIDRLIVRICGMRPKVSYEESCKLVSANIKALAERLDIKRLAAVGAVEEGIVRDIIALVSGGDFSMEYVGDILGGSDAVNALSAYDDIIMFAQEDVTSIDSILRHKDLASYWGKNMVGAVSVR
ncbi:MAG TPA: hypothetical protein PL035_00260 [Bacillota bacterium]|nr:hypothetical protein [Bacillota bacterium]